MRDALRSAIADVRAEHSDSCDLAAGSPSATVAAWRLTGASLEYLVLCDSSILLALADRRYLDVTDTRLDEVVEPSVHEAMAQCTHSGATNLRQDILAARRGAVEALRNTKEGFWCCHHDPAAADEAVASSSGRSERRRTKICRPLPRGPSRITMTPPWSAVWPGRPS